MIEMVGVRQEGVEGIYQLVFWRQNRDMRSCYGSICRPDSRTQSIVAPPIGGYTSVLPGVEQLGQYKEFMLAKSLDRFLFTHEQDKQDQHTGN